MAMKPRAMKKMKRGGDTSDPAWLKALKKEAEQLGVPLRELMTMYEKGRDPKKAVKMKAAKGGVAKKKPMRGGGMGKKKMMRGGMSKKKK
tara:strand:+ start:1638 stop:1907 length:270 start_codon:yes stop_codon:yes gene_type:complete